MREGCECILTQEVAYIDAIPIGEGECPICLKIGPRLAGYYGVLQSDCKHEWCDEDCRGTIVQKRREFLGLTRRQLGKLVGLKTSTIRRYENNRCPDGFWNKTTELIKVKQREQDG